MPKGGLGNLIALPLQGEAVHSGNALFIQEDGTPFENQWEFLRTLRKITRAELDAVLLAHPGDIGMTWESRIRTDWPRPELNFCMGHPNHTMPRSAQATNPKHQQSALGTNPRSTRQYPIWYSPSCCLPQPRVFSPPTAAFFPVEHPKNPIHGRQLR